MRNDVENIQIINYLLLVYIFSIFIVFTFYIPFESWKTYEYALMFFMFYILIF